MGSRIVLLLLVVTTLMASGKKFELKREKYPTQIELTKRTNVPPPELAPGKESIRVAEWTLQGPFPTMISLAPTGAHKPSRN